MSTDDFVTDVPRTSFSPQSDGPTGAPSGAPHGQTLEQARFHVDELTDAIEAADIDDYLSDQDGVIGVTVSTIDESVEVAYDPERVTAALIRQKLENAGHPADGQ